MNVAKRNMMMMIDEDEYMREFNVRTLYGSGK